MVGGNCTFGATLGHRVAAIWCGCRGRKVEQDRVEAAKRFRMAAEEGNPVAMKIVEMMENFDPEE